jgi:hypothetical protein
MIDVRVTARLWTCEPRQQKETSSTLLTVTEKGQLCQIQEALIAGDIETLKKVFASQEFKSSGERIARVLQVQMENRPSTIA